MLQPESNRAAVVLQPGTVAAVSHALGERNGEPLIHGLDGMLRYAKAYSLCFDSPLCNDYFLGPHWLETVKGLRGLLNGQGVVAMERDRSTDSKDDGVCEAIFWEAMEAAGFTEADL